VAGVFMLVMPVMFCVFMPVMMWFSIVAVAMTMLLMVFTFMMMFVMVLTPMGMAVFMTVLFVVGGMVVFMSAAHLRSSYSLVSGISPLSGPYSNFR
jgi:hypothetical protein